MPEKFEGPCVGIDLGTTYSCVAVMRNNNVEIIANDQGNRTTPSFVAFTEDDRLVGEAAKNQAAMNPTNTIFGAKRCIGRAIGDKELKKDMELWPFKVQGGKFGKPEFVVHFMGEEKRFTAEQISAMVLEKMKATAEAYMGEEVKNAVITCPAYFNDQQRQATKNAGILAGLNVMRVINEPTAAALSYGLLDTKTSDKEKNVLIFDLGGGTFDVSLLAIDEGVFEVKATAGDTHLGGEDFDQKLMEHFVKEFKRKHRQDISKNDRSMRRLRNACERAKRALSSTTKTTVEIDSLFEGIDFSTSLTRARFEDLCMKFFEATMVPVDKVLEDAKIAKGEVDEVVLVGGSTRIPKIQEMLQRYFNGKELCRSVNPDEAVAYGAAVQAAVLTGGNGNSKVEDILLIDVTPLSLGIETAGGVMSRIIPRQTTIPVQRSIQVSTFQDNQTTLNVQVFEGERALTKDCHTLGSFKLTGITPQPRAVPKIEVSFNLDADGLLTVSAEDKKTGNKAEVAIKAESGRLSQDEIEKMLAEAESLKEADKKSAQRIRQYNELESYYFRVRNFESDRAEFTEEDKKALQEVARDLINFIDEAESPSIEELDEQKALVDAVYLPIKTKLYEAVQAEEAVAREAAKAKAAEEAEAKAAEAAANGGEEGGEPGAFPTEVVHIDTKEAFDAAIQSSALTVVDFYATWCAPCTQIAPEYKTLPATYPTAQFLKVDVDKNKEAAQFAEIKAMPTFVFYKNGSEVHRFEGANINGVKQYVADNL